MRVVRLTPGNVERYRAGVVALEALAEYPLGADFFHLDHGGDYFAFFRRLGELRYYAMVDGARVVAVGAGILRDVPAPGGGTVRTWYLCDLKVHPDLRGKHLPLRLLGAAFLPCYLRCRRGYAISMNPGDGRPNPVTKLLGRFRWAPLRAAGRLVFYSLSHDEMVRARPLVERHRGPVSFLSLRGKKDLILRSTGSALALLHVQHGACAERGESEPRSGHVHMLCAPEGDPLAAALDASGTRPSADATVLSHAMTGWDWKFVLTSDI